MLCIYIYIAHSVINFNLFLFLCRSTIKKMLKMAAWQTSQSNYISDKYPQPKNSIKLNFGNVELLIMSRHKHNAIPRENCLIFKRVMIVEMRITSPV